MASIENLTPVTENEANMLLNEMRQKALATDQRNLVGEFLVGRSISCQQAGSLLEAVKLGLMQRMLVFEVLHGRLTDLPDGLPYVLEPLSGPIRRDVEALALGRTGARKYSLEKPQLGAHWKSGMTSYEPIHMDNSSMSTFEPTKLDSYIQRVPSRTLSSGSVERTVERTVIMKEKIVERRQPDPVVTECVDRLRNHVQKGQVSEALYKDLKAVFDALDLGPLPAPALMDSGSSPVAPSGPLSRDAAPPPISGVPWPAAEPPVDTPPSVQFTRLGNNAPRESDGYSTVSDESV